MGRWRRSGRRAAIESVIVKNKGEVMAYAIRGPKLELGETWSSG